MKFCKCVYIHIHSSKNMHKLPPHKKEPQTHKKKVLEKGIYSFGFAFNKEFEATLLLTFFLILQIKVLLC